MKDPKIALASTVAERARWLLALTRRELLKGGAAVTAAAFVPALGGCSSDDGAGGSGGSGGGGPTGPETLFQHGVASGDPLPNAVMLWTRVTPDGSDPLDVSWEVASDPAFGTIVKKGSFTTNPDRDFTVKVDADGLAAGTTYYYRFKAQNRTSPIGRTRTAPTGGVARLRFGLLSCSSFAHGYFHVYRAVAARPDLDAVLHLGDYIYEYKNGSGGYGDVRLYEPDNEILSLSDYRTRHSQYKRDADLQAVHRQHPFIAVWDDHESANDSYKDGAENHDPATEGAWAERKANALKAYFEWMPIREAADGHIYRKLSYGDLADLVMLDTRLWGRTLGGGLAGPPPEPDPNRTLLGDEQAAWFEEQLTTSTAKWKLVGQQVMVANLFLSPTSLANLDQWHGYPESRKRLIDFLRSSNAQDVVVLTGDIHSSWASELVNDPNDATEYDPVTGDGAVAVEFVTPAVTSPGIPANLLPYIDSSRQYNLHLRYIEPTLRGYVILDVTPERTQAAWFHFDDITKETPGTESFATAWSVKTGETRLNEDAAPALDRADAPELAP